VSFRFSETAGAGSDSVNGFWNHSRGVDANLRSARKIGRFDARRKIGRSGLVAVFLAPTVTSATAANFGVSFGPPKFP